MARPNGVVIASDRYFAFAGRDGSLLEGEMPKVPRFARRIPLLRGIARLGMSVSPLLQRGGVAGQLERLMLFAVLLAPIAFIFLPGAEHRAIAAAEEGQLGRTWEGVARPSRFSLRCGTNFVALALPMSLLADRLWPFAPALWTPVVVAVLSLGLTMELWRAVQSSTLTAARAFLVPGLALQRLTTREPAIEETRIALTAVAS